MAKIDFKKTLKTLYGAPKGRFARVDVPMLRYVMVDGRGDPNTAPAYKTAIEWLYPVSYAMKFASKRELGKDYVVPPLEGLWCADDPADFVARRKDRWRWTMMTMVPDFVGQDLYEAALAKTRTKLGEPPATLRFEKVDRRSVTADAAYRQLRRRGSDPGSSPRRADAGAKSRLQWTASRGLPQRSPQDAARQAQDHPAPAGEGGAGPKAELRPTVVSSPSRRRSLRASDGRIRVHSTSAHDRGEDAPACRSMMSTSRRRTRQAPRSAVSSKSDAARDNTPCPQSGQWTATVTQG